jgi:uncharacterized protein YPO0396
MTFPAATNEQRMTKYIEHKRSAAVRRWLKEEIAEQKARYKEIVKRINGDLAPKRERWYAEFLERIQTRGFSVHYNQLRQITPDELPKKPRRKHKAVY